MSVLSTFAVRADERPFLCEWGLQGGLGYYVGDATDHIFNDIQWAAGTHFRYKFDQRWALQVKGQVQNMVFPLQNEVGMQLDAKGDNFLLNLDVMGEFNFFRFGLKQYDERVKQFTPYIFLGVGVSSYSNFGDWAAYFPFGLGLKWKFAQRWGLNLAWQHNLYFADNLEGKDYYDNTQDLNGSNILKNDLTSSLTLGIVFEFGKAAKVCHTCE